MRGVLRLLRLQIWILGILLRQLCKILRGRVSRVFNVYLVLGRSLLLDLLDLLLALLLLGICLLLVELDLIRIRCLLRRRVRLWLRHLRSVRLLLWGVCLLLR